MQSAPGEDGARGPGSAELAEAAQGTRHLSPSPVVVTSVPTDGSAGGRAVRRADGCGGPEPVGDGLARPRVAQREAPGRLGERGSWPS